MTFHNDISGILKNIHLQNNHHKKIHLGLSYRLVFWLCCAKLLNDFNREIFINKN